ncbi:DoxX family protein [Flaviflagellibacter deserti]|jgi:putative oxidoreductase|uniref:DoxX family protein n=1 Tax=Flaviflagellibacter deserti TaxID=2267266 RepID=A0ABV9YX48_9HYPH
MADLRTAAYGALLLRLSLGTMWISHALLKLIVFTVPGFAGFLQSLGMPGFLAGPVIAAELIGGVLILTGFYGRYVSILLIPVMLGAMSAHIGNGWVFSAPNGGWEYPLFLMMASLAHGLIGDGALALRSHPLPVLGRLATN